MSIVIIQPQVEALDPLTPHELAMQAAGYGTPTWKWQSQRRMAPMNTRGTPAANARGMATGFPGIKRIRMPFNRCMINGTPDFPGMHWEMKEFLLELVRLDYEFLWVQMDGPSQELGSGGEWANYHMFYPDAWVPVDTLDQWRDFMKPGGLMSNNHIANFKALIDWIETEAPTMKVFGFEAINEPVTYRRPGSKYGAAVNAEVMGYYVDHCLRIRDYVESRMPGRDFYVDGWAYSTDFESFRNIKLPAYDNKTAMQVFRERIPSGRTGKLVWSAHLYADWMATPYSHKALYDEFDRRWSHLIQDRFVITETSLESNGDDWRFNDQTDWNKWFLARVGDWFRDRGTGLGWFTSHNYGGGKLMTIFKNGEILIHSQSSFGSFYNMACGADRTGELILAPRSGPQPLTRVRAARGLQNQPFDPSPGVDDPAGYYTLGFGGLGTCLLQGHDDANNFLYGGPGKTIIYGGALDDYMYLGTGGGVVRCGAGQQSTIGTNGGDNRIYTGPHVNLVTCIHGRSTIICDPAGVTRIFGFDPAKGDRLSVKGAYANADAMRASGARVASGGWRVSDTNAEFTTPQGGKIILLHQGAQVDLIPFYVLDFTDGWYAPGWQEPPDYTPDEFGAPFAPVPPILVDGAAPPPLIEGPKDALGQPVIVRDAQGRIVQFQFARMAA